jgi:hypothetical protein
MKEFGIKLNGVKKSGGNPKNVYTSNRIVGSNLALSAIF